MQKKVAFKKKFYTTVTKKKFQRLNVENKNKKQFKNQPVGRQEKTGGKSHENKFGNSERKQDSDGNFQIRCTCCKLIHHKHCCQRSGPGPFIPGKQW